MIMNDAGRRYGKTAYQKNLARDYSLYHKCRKPDCMRKVKIGTLYCCHACDLADQGKYEIHDSGILGHSSVCNKNAADRGELSGIFEITLFTQKDED